MKIIYPDKITAIGASSENPNYPALNMLDDVPKKIWQSADNNACSVQIDFSDSENISVTDILIYFTNISGTLKTYTLSDTLVQTISLSVLTGDKYTYPITWIELDGTAVAYAVIEIAATADDYSYIGIIRAGTCYEFQSPKIGMGASIANRSRLFEMHDGSSKHLKLSSGKSFKVECRSLYDTLTIQAEMMLNLQSIGYTPVACQLFDNLPLFSQIVNVSASYDGAYAGRVSFDLNEVF